MTHKSRGIEKHAAGLEELKQGRGLEAITWACKGGLLGKKTIGDDAFFGPGSDAFFFFFLEL